MSGLFSTLGYYVENRRKLFEKHDYIAFFFAKNFIDHMNSENFPFLLKKNDEHFPNAKLANVWKVKEFGTPLLLLHLTKTLFLKAARTQARTLRLHYLFVVLIYLTLSRFQ